MTTLSLQSISEISGGNFWEDAVVVACATVGAGTLVYQLGIYTNWWNPVGWLSGGLMIADAACIANLFS